MLQLKSFLFAAFLVAAVSCEECSNPQIKSSVYVTQEAALSAEAVVSTTFNVRCGNSKSMLPVSICYAFHIPFSIFVCILVRCLC